jgi:RNA recognition motif-containing protein
MKRIIARETLLAYPDFNQPFNIHTDASHTQLGAVISQNNKPIAFYSRKLNPAQTRYTTTERELLSIVETLKEFKNILLGHRIKIYTDHKNLTYVNFKTERVMRWRLIIEEYSPELIYVKGETNIVADALSRLDLATSDTSPSDMHDMQYLADNFSLEDDDLPNDAYPLQYKLIAKHQNLQKDLFVKLNKQHDGFHLKSFCGGGRNEV